MDFHYETDMDNDFSDDEEPEIDFLYYAGKDNIDKFLEVNENLFRSSYYCEKILDIINSKLCFIVHPRNLNFFLDLKGFYPNPIKLYLCTGESTCNFQKRIDFFKKNAWFTRIEYLNYNDSYFQKQEIVEILSKANIHSRNIRKIKFVPKKRFKFTQVLKDEILLSNKFEEMKI